MKNIILFLLVVSSAKSYAQDLPAAGGVSNNIIGHTAFAEAYDVNGKPLTEVNKKVAGSSVLNENWGKGQVQFQTGFVLKNVELQFDLYSNELHFRKDNIGYYFVDPLKEFSIEFMDNDQLRSVIFRSGYPPTQKKTVSSFYKVIADGANAQLLNYISKEIRENYTYAGPVMNEYQVNDNYFVYDVKEGTIKNINLNKASFIKALPAYVDVIEKFTDQTDYKLKSENELVELFKIINKK